MDYLASERARQRRANPLLILPECRSILVLGICYPNPTMVTQPISRGIYGRVSSYAWRDDYHEDIVERLKVLVAFIEDEIGSKFPNRWYTDTGPVMERDLAQRAGLGWIGKNTCLINPELGSYLFLAEIFLGVKLDSDMPIEVDRCGTCTRCIDACPTKCILPNRTLDASRCISYLTIELKDAIPLELRPQVGEWIFGCDVCQQVCPWNQHIMVQGGDPVFTPRKNVPFPNLLTELQLSPQAFNRKFKGSPVKRTKRRGYLRNVTVAVGNLTAVHGSAITEEAVDVLSKVLRKESEPLVRVHAAWALGEILNEGARRALESAEKTEVDRQVLSEIQTVLTD
jgi:epoxyqueuosine reductase